MTSETGEGRWRVATEPLEVTTWTVVSDGATVVVVVPPDEVKTWLTVGELSIGTEVVPPLEVTAVISDGKERTYELETSGELSTKAELETWTV
jgi:hypothetical protein